MSFAKIYFLRNKFVLIASIKSFRVILCNFINILSIAVNCHLKLEAWTNFSLKDETWAKFSTLEVAICMLHNFGVISKTAKLKVENSGQTTSRFSPVSYHAHR